MKHLESSPGELDKDTRVDTVQTQQLENLSRLWCKLVDTPDTDNKGELGLSGNIVAALGLGLTTETDLITFLRSVFLDVLFSTLEDDLALILAFLSIELARVHV